MNRLAIPAILAVTLSVLGVLSPSSAPGKEAGAKATVVLVHGAFAGSSS